LDQLLACIKGKSVYGLDDQPCLGDGNWGGCDHDSGS
jgi:hypothetical protein